MERYIKYKRFSESHNETSLQGLYDKLITEGWDIIYYNEIMHPVGAQANPADIMIHVVILAGKRQGDTLTKTVVL